MCMFALSLSRIELPTADARHPFQDIMKRREKDDQ